MSETPERADVPSDERPMLELTYEVKGTYRLKLDPAKWAEDFGDWFELYGEDGELPTPQQIHEAIVGVRHLPEMFRDHLIQESADDVHCIDADMDDYDLRVKWVAR
ncbi:hypothetical protein [Actinomycetospora aeridis]|uniref:Uncharacterized protein n=1 Tax=Actinomycetospora aeridis TaxID=3129231 RepID=A0ABU8N175_9PSEU